MARDKLEGRGRGCYGEADAQRETVLIGLATEHEIAQAQSLKD